MFSVEGQPLNVLKGHKNDVLTVEWFDENSIISCGDDSTLRYWNLIDNSCSRIVDLGGMETDTLCITSSGLIVSGNDDGELICFDGDGNRLSVLKAHESGVKRLLINEEIIISLSYDRTFKIWSLQGKELVLKNSGETPSIVWPRSCAVLDENRIAFVTFGDRVAIYNLGDELWDIGNIEDTNGINAILVNGDDLYTVGDSGVVFINGKKINKVPSLCNFIIEFEGEIFCGGQDGVVYNALTSKALYRHHSPLNCADIVNVDGIKSLLVGAYTGEIIQLSLVQGDLTLIATHKVHANAIKDVCTNGHYMFTACADHRVKLSEFVDNKVLQEKFSDSHENIVNGCAAHNNSFVSISRDLTLRIWSIDGDSKVIKTPHKNSIKCISSDGENLISSGDYRGTLSIFNANKNTFKSKKVSVCGISSIEYSKSGNEFIAATYDGKIHRVKL